MKSTKPVPPVHVRREGVHLDRERALLTIPGAASVGTILVFLILNTCLWKYLRK